MLRLVENVRRKQLAWIAAILEHKKWRPSRLAREAGIDHSTLSKFLNDADNIAQLGTTSIEKIAALKIIPPYQTQPPALPAGLEAGETAPYVPVSGDPAMAVLTALRAGRNGVDAWILHSRALENAGYVAGDILVVDLNADPKPGDAVCAQVYDRSGKAETVIRLYEHPFLVAATMDGTFFRPLLVDNDMVVIRGVVIGSYRRRRAVAA